MVAVASARYFHAARSGRCLQTVAADAGALRVLDGSGFANGATVSAGAGIMVGNVAVVSSTRLTATFTIAADATGRRRPPDAVRVGLPRGHGIRVGPDPDGHRHVLRRHLGGGDGRHSIAGLTDTRTAGPASDTAPV